MDVEVLQDLAAAYGVGTPRFEPDDDEAVATDVLPSSLSGDEDEQLAVRL